MRRRAGDLLDLKTNSWGTLRPVAQAGTRRKSGAGELIGKILKWNQLHNNLMVKFHIKKLVFNN